MEALVGKIVKVVNSCVTAQQLKIAENFAQRARKQIHWNEWLDIASLIKKKAAKLLLFDIEDGTVVRRS